MKMLKLVCTLNTHVITDEGDFVPAGTPVQVMGWSGYDRATRGDSGGDKKPATVEVRTAAYMYAETFSYGEIEGGYDTGAVGRGLYLSVPPDALLYSNETHMCDVKQRRQAEKAAS